MPLRAREGNNSQRSIQDRRFHGTLGGLSSHNDVSGCGNAFCWSKIDAVLIDINFLLRASSILATVLLYSALFYLHSLATPKLNAILLDTIARFLSLNETKNL